MRPGRQREEHRAALDRRFRQLQAELAGVLPSRPDAAEVPGRGSEAESAAEPGASAEPTAARPPGRHAAPRWTLTPAHLRVVAVLLVVALVVTGWWLVRSRPEALPTEVGLTGAASAPAATVEPAPPPTGSTASPVGDAPASDDPADASRRVVVHVAGKVRRPGIVRLPAGSRVVDALEAAGGARPGVALRHVNLARELVDGEQVLVGLPGEAAASAAGSAGGTDDDGPAPVNLNTADATELETLPGIGPVTAGKILDWRAEHGRFSAVEELLEVDGIGDATLADLAPLVTV